MFKFLQRLTGKIIFSAAGVFLLFIATAGYSNLWNTVGDKLNPRTLSGSAIETFAADLITLKKTPPLTRLTFVGDIMLARGVKSSIEKNFGGDYNRIFENVSELKDSDILFGNLEGDISDVGHNVGSKFSFRMDPKSTDAIKNAGFDIVSFANNHAGDWSNIAFDDTRKRLSDSGILYSGAGDNTEDTKTPRIIIKNNIKIGFIGFTDVGPNWLAATSTTSGILLASDPEFDTIISNAKSQVDYLVISFHYGNEYLPHTNRQELLSHKAIDSGADLIIGAHPHIVQDVEKYKNGIIAYSLGNFIFDQGFSENTMEGGVFEVTLDGKKVIDTQMRTVHLNNKYQPQYIEPQYHNPSGDEVKLEKESASDEGGSGGLLDFVFNLLKDVNASPETPQVVSPIVEQTLYPEIGTTSKPENSPVMLTFADRIQNIPSLRSGVKDTNLSSPKSVRFSPDGKKVYINSLENFRTLIYDVSTHKSIASILQKIESISPNILLASASPKIELFGKPVESNFLKDGKYLLVPYYRFSNDVNGVLPSAVAVIDTNTNLITKVLPSGSVTKNIAVSPHENYAAVTNWGENTVTLYDVSSDNALDFKVEDTLVVGRKFTPDVSGGPVDRDAVCSLCVRGILFSPDEQTLFVGLMAGGGIAGFDIPTKKFLGIVTKDNLFPRDLTLSPDQKTVYISSYNAGSIERVSIDDLTISLRSALGATISQPKIFEGVTVGKLPRSLKLSPDGHYAFIALNGPSEIAVVDTKTFKVVSRIRTDAFTVGLDISPDGKTLWTTSQGHSGIGGNAVDIFEIEYN